MLKRPEILFATEPPAAGTLWVAYSGGMDSTVLLHALARRWPERVRAVHVHHGLQTAADTWVQHCRAACAGLDVPLRVLRVRVDAKHADGPEAAARAARYAALRKLLRKDDLLATAHHQDDQAETVLMRLLRGTGLAGLTGMSEWRAGLWRPLLAYPRSHLLAYAQVHQLRWIEDPHNHEPRYARSWLRQDILPRLQARWPQAAQNIARLSRLAAESAQLLDELAAQDLAQADAGNNGLSVKALLDLSAPRRHNLLRGWLAQKGWLPPAAEQFSRLDDEVLAARADAQPLLNCGPYEFRRYRDQLFVMTPLAPAPGEVSLRWSGGQLELPAGCGELRGPARLRPALTVRFVQGGERLRLAVGQPTRTLKNLFQENGVPPWERLRTPLIYRDEVLLGAGNWLSADAGKLRLRWKSDFS